jgi:hypothetical protein
MCFGCTLGTNNRCYSDVAAPSQSSRLLLGSSPCNEASGSRETLDFAAARLNDVLKGTAAESFELPPEIDVSCSHISRV